MLSFKFNSQILAVHCVLISFSLVGCDPGYHPKLNEVTGRVTAIALPWEAPNNNSVRVRLEDYNHQVNTRGLKIGECVATLHDVEIEIEFKSSQTGQNTRKSAKFSTWRIGEVKLIEGLSIDRSFNTLYIHGTARNINELRHTEDYENFPVIIDAEFDDVIWDADKRVFRPRYGDY